MDNRSSTRNSCVCITCASQYCLECRHQEASYCTCDKLEPSQDKLTQIYDSNQVKHQTESNEAPENQQIKSAPDEFDTNADAVGSEPIVISCGQPSKNEKENEDNNKDDYKPTKEKKVEKCKTCHKVLDEKSGAKICPAFCPTCHKIFIDEEDDEQPSKKNIIMLNECPRCQKAAPVTKKNRPLKYSDIEEINKCQAKKNRPDHCPSHKHGDTTAKVYSPKPENKTTGQQTEERPPPEPKSFWEWLKELLGISKPEASTNNVDTDSKSIDKIPKCSKCKELKINSQSKEDRLGISKPEAPTDNVDTDTKSIDERPKCSKCKELKINSQSKEDRNCPKLCENFKEMNYSPEPVQKQIQPKEKLETETIKKCHTDCGVNTYTQTEEKNEGALNSDNLSTEQKDNIRIWIKECVHKELEDVRKPVNNEGKKTNGKTSSKDTSQPSKNHGSRSCAFRANIKDVIKDNISGSNKTDVNAAESVKTETSGETSAKINDKCAENLEQSIKKSCACDLCECIKCDNVKDKHKKTSFIVAPMISVRERQQRPYCQCTFCECIECVHRCETFAQTRYTEKTSTDERRYYMKCSCNHCENNKCEKQGKCSCDRLSTFTREPVTRNKNEYDIKDCINEKRNVKNYEHYYKNKRSPLTIYTSLMHQLYYPRAKPSIDSTYSSLGSRTTSVSIIPQNYWALRANAHLISDSINQCDCKPCECHKCKKHFLEGHIPYRQCNCSCEICDCINCATLNIYCELEKKFNEKSEQMCNCLPCHCKQCVKYRNIIVHDGYDNSNCGVAISSLDSDNLLSLAKVTDSERCNDCVLFNKESKNLNTAINRSILSKKTIDLSNHDKSQKNEYHVPCNKSICIKPGVKYNNSLDHQDSKFCCQKKDRESRDIHSSRNSSQISDNTEGNDSTISSSMSSNVRINEPNNKESKKRKSIRRSSCNSSGYDSSDYLIHFPKSTVETCIKDVMSLLYNKPDKDYSNLSPTSKPVKDYSESPMNTVHYQNELPIPGQSFDTLQLADTCKSCKSENSDKSCDCDKCYYKIPKLKRCRCACVGCRCDGTCLSEDISVLIRKTETTQTSIFAPDCGEVDRKEISSLKFKKSIATFSDKNKIVKWTDLPMSKCAYNTKNSTVNELPTVNYDSVQRTIREAKTFSLQLLDILQKYEKANRDLDIMRQRYKSLHKSILCEDVDGKQFSEHPNNYQIGFIKTLPTYKNNTNIEKSRIKFEDGMLENSKLSTTVTGIHSTAFETDMPKQIQESDIKLDDGKIFQDICIQNSLNKNASKPSFENSKYSNQDNIKQTESTSNDDHSQLNQINVIDTATFANSARKSYLKKLKSEYKEYSLHLEEAINNNHRQTVRKNKKCDTMIESQVKENITNKYSTPSNWNGFSYQIPPVNEFINKQNSGVLNTVFICQSQKYHESYRNNKTFPKKLDVEQLDSLKEIVVADKNETSFANSLNADHDSVQLSSTVRYMQSQDQQPFGSSTSSPRIASKRFELSKIRSTTIKTDAIKTCSSNSLKVIFQMIRKVSEHSILLKWKIPEDIKNIEGYEVKVDGRSIQRILNPTRNIAVLTCLPHTAKMLITVRTITKMAEGLTPCATISYCNRA